MSLARALRTLVITGTCLSSGAVAAQKADAPEQAPKATFRSAVDVVTVTAVVRDRKGRFVQNLGRADFVVAERGVQKAILDFRSQTNGPVKLALLVDVSGSMRVGSKAIDAKLAARQLFAVLGPSDEAALFVFDTALRQVTAFTSDMQALDAAMDLVDPPYGQTSLYDALAKTAQQAAREARGAGTLPQRTAVVVLTDGVDTKSRLTPGEVSGIASAIDVPVYVLAVMAGIDEMRTAERNAGGVEATGLRSLSEWTGGGLFTASAPAHASVAARQIVAELRHQYVLAFEASNHAGWRPLEVRAKDGALVVRARAGYTAGPGDRGGAQGDSSTGTAGAAPWIQGKKP